MNTRGLTDVSIALIRKTIHDYLLTWLAAVTLLVAFVVMYMFIVGSMMERQTNIFEIVDGLGMDWVRKLISALIGSEVEQAMTPTGLASFAFAHPLVWTVMIAFLFTVTSGVISGEIDRGTMDLLATLPISRGRIYGTLSLVVMCMGLPICAAIWVGAAIGKYLSNTPAVDLAALGLLGAHLYVVFIMLACFSLAVSAMCSRRGSALAIAFLVVFYSFVLNVLVAFWEPVKKIAFTGFLNYYAPLPITRDHAWRTGDLAVLLAAAAVCWAAGFIVFRRRDVPAS